MIKKLLSIGILVLTFFLSTSISPSVSSAEDVWFYTHHGWESYIVTDTIKNIEDRHPQYTVFVKHVRNGKCEGTFEILGFAYENGTLISYVFNRYKMSWDWEYPGRVSEDPYTSAAWRAMQPYLQKGK